MGLFEVPATRRVSAIRINKSVGVVIGIPIPVEVGSVGGVGRHRINRQEPSRHRIIVALLHVVDAGLGIVDVAGEAGALGRRAWATATTTRRWRAGITA